MKGALENLTDYMYLIIAIVIGGLMFYFIAQTSGLFGGSNDTTAYGDSAQVSKRIATEIEDCWAKHRGGLDSLSDVCNELQVNATQAFSEWTVTKVLDCKKIPNNKCSIGNCSFCFSPNYDGNDRVGWSVKDRNAVISISYSGSERRIMVQEISGSSLPTNNRSDNSSKVNDSCIVLDYNGNPKDKLDIVLVGWGYNESLFYPIAKSQRDTLLFFEPFKSNSRKVNIYMANVSALPNCHYCRPCRFNEISGEVECDIPNNDWNYSGCCNTSSAWTVARSCPADVVIVVQADVIDDSGLPWDYSGLWGRSNFCKNLSVLFNVTEPFNKNAIVQEIGNSFGCLNYEYTHLIAEPSQGPSYNCDNISTCPKWSGVSGTSCLGGCGYEGWYRSADDCVMNVLANNRYCPVCQLRLKELLSKYN
jgi:hypothetical protein